MKLFKLYLSLIIFIILLAYKAVAQNQTVVSGSATNIISFPATGCTYTWVNDKPEIGLAASGSGNVASFTAINTTNAPIVATVTATPASLSYAYIANSTSGTVSVISTQTKSVIATIPVGSYPFGIAVSPDNSLVYVVNSSSASVSVISTATNTVIATIPVGTAPQVVAFSRDGTRAYVASNNNTISVIDPATHTVINSIHTAAAPEGIAVSADGSKIYIANNLAGTVSVIDPITGTMLNTITVGSFTCGIALNPAGTRLYTANAGAGTMSVINTTTNTVIASPAVSGNPQFITVSADGSKVYVASYGGYISVFNAATNTNITTTMESTPRSIGLTPDGLSIYLVSGDGYVDVQDLNFSNNTRIPVGTNPGAYGNFMAISPGSCTGPPVTFTITVNPSPIVTAGSVTGSISACTGTASSSPNIQQFTISGTGLSGNITATPPAGFEISTSAGSGYGNSLSLTPTTGTVGNITIYVRSAASAAAGSLSGNIILSSPGATTQNIAVTGTVNALPTVNTISNKTVLSGASITAINFTGTSSGYTWVNNTPGIGLAATGTGNIPSFIGVNTTAVPITATITVTPAATETAYIADFDAQKVSVVDITNKIVVKDIPMPGKAYGVTVNNYDDKVYVTSQNYVTVGGMMSETQGSVAVIDPVTNTVLTNIMVGKDPRGIITAPDGKHIYVANNQSATVSVIDVANNTVSATIPVDNGPIDVKISPDGKTMYVIYNLVNTISVVSLTTNAITATIALPAINDISLAISPDGKKLFATSLGGNAVFVINTVTNSIITRIFTNGAYGTAISPDGSQLFVSSYNIDYIYSHNAIANTYGAVMPTPTTVSGVSMSANGKLVYLVSANWAALYAYNPATYATNQIVALSPNTDRFSVGNFIRAGTGCAGSPITFTITVNPTTNLSTAGNLAAVNTIYGTSSPSTSFMVSGANLTSSVLVTPPVGFEVSTDNVNFTNTVTITNTGTVSSVPVYIRLTSAMAVSSYSGNVVLSSTGAQNINVAMPASTVSPAPLTITANDVNKTYGSTLTNTANSTAFSIPSGALKNGNTITTVNLTYGTGAAATAAVGTYLSISSAISTSGNGFLSSNYNITYQPGNIIVAPAPLTIIANDINKPYGAILTTVVASTTFTSIGLQNQETIGTVTILYGNGSATTDPTAVYHNVITPTTPTGGTFVASNYVITYKTGNITVEAPIAIIASGTLASLITIYGTASASTTFTLSGTGLSAGILVTPPAGFEVSVDNTLFYPTVTIGNGGTIASTAVYIRLSPLTPVGSYTGNILFSSAGTNSSLTMTKGTVNSAPLTITADNKSKVFGTTNPVLTVSYSGFVNNETAAVISTLPTIITTATTTSAVGQYFITPGGAVSPNYGINYVEGILTISPLPLSIVIPNAFTPNGDGYNDLWNIPVLAFYNNNNVSVFDRSGARVFYSSGYSISWDGTYNGSKLPVGTYYYVILVEVNRKIQTFSGPVTIIR